MRKLLFILLLSLFPMNALADTHSLSDGHGACTSFKNKRGKLGFFCKTMYKGSGLVFFKLDYPVDAGLLKEDLTLRLINRDTGQVIRIRHSYTSVNTESGNLTRTVIWALPEVIEDIFKNVMNADIEFVIGEKIHTFILNKEERDQIKFVSGIDLMIELSHD